MTNLNCLGRQSRRTLPHSSGSRCDLVVPPLRSRLNGFSPPLHVFQLIAVLTFAFMATVGFGVYIPLLPQPWSTAAYTLIGAAFVLHLLGHAAAVSIDPADVSVRTRKNYSSPMPAFDSSKNQHVIHNLHCSLCEVDVGPRAKHCSTCNKCIADFDHHCKWLNNCVGGRNYWFFFVAVSSAVVGMILLLLVLLFVFIEHYVNPVVLRTAPQFQTVKANGTWLMFLPATPLEVGSFSLLALAFITALLDLAALLLLLHLLCFHLHLLFQGISTYEYIVRKRQTPGTKDKQPDPPPLQPNETTARSPLDFDSHLAGRSCTFKLEEQQNGQTSSRLPEPICAEMEEASGERNLDYSSSESPSRIIPGEPMMSLPVSLSGTEPQVQVKPIVQDPLGSSIMVHQQLRTEP